MCVETGDLSLQTHNQAPSDLKGFQICCDFKSYTESVWKEENKFLHSSPGGTDGMKQCVLCYLVLWVHASNWGIFWQVWECSQRRIHTDGHLLGTVHAGRGCWAKNERNARLMVYLAKYWRKKNRTGGCPEIKAAVNHVFYIFPIKGNKLQLSMNLCECFIFQWFPFTME